MKSKQRYLCKRCKCNFTQSSLRGKDGELKVFALTLNRIGYNMSYIANLIGVSSTSVMNWKSQYNHLIELPKPFEGNIYVFPDEIWKDIKSRLN